MKYILLILAAIVAACSVPPPNPVRVEAPISLEVVITREEVKEAPKPKPKVDKTMPHCKGIDAGDLNNTINQKIDCLLNETAK